MKLGFCRKSYPDELFYSYVRSLCVENGILRLQDLEWYLRLKEFVRFNGLYPSGLSLICDVVENATFPDVETALHMTPYFTDIDGLQAGQQAKLAEGILQPCSAAVPDVKKRSRTLKICPICYEMDKKEYGESYLHVMHQIKDIDICFEHGCKLQTVTSVASRDLIEPYNCDHKIEMVADIDTCKMQKKRLEEQIQKNAACMQQSICPTCGKAYLEHTWSVKTKAGCPFCNIKKSAEMIIQIRLPEKYYIKEKIKGIQTAKVVHRPCGVPIRKLDAILYSEVPECHECQMLKPAHLQEKYDPEQINWVFADVTAEDRKKKKIKVMHKQCGQEFVMFANAFRKKPEGYCPVCDSKIEVKDIQAVDVDYEIVGEYKNNVEQVDILHKSCGIVFKMSKNSFLAGGRCPVCTPRWDLRTVVSAVEECSSGYEVNPAPKRGWAIICKDGRSITESYTKIMCDLMSEESVIFTDKQKVYVPERTLRKKILDNVRKYTDQKGYWEFADGLDGEVVTRVQRNLIQDMSKMGYLVRIGKGRYVWQGYQ